MEVHTLVHTTWFPGYQPTEFSAEGYEDHQSRGMQKGVCTHTPGVLYIDPSLQEENGVSKSTFDRLSLAIESQGQPFISIVQSPGSAGLNQKGHRRPKRRRDLITKFDIACVGIPELQSLKHGTGCSTRWVGDCSPMAWKRFRCPLQTLRPPTEKADPQP